MERLLVGVSGSAAVFNLLSYLVVLRRTLSREVRVIMIAAADALLPASTVAHVCDGLFLNGPPGVERRPRHLELARWAETIVILPATANLPGLVANGGSQRPRSEPAGDHHTGLRGARDLLPECHNCAMWRKPVVQRNVETSAPTGTG